MAKKNETNKEDAIDMLAALLDDIRSVGLRIGIADAPATEKRKAGILIFVEDAGLDGEGLILRE